MENVTFHCSQCGNLMAVSPADAGQQVRCPTCQQVVTAPAATPAPAPAPVFNFKPPEEHESIFAPADDHDVLFGAAAPRVEMPPEPTPPLAAPALELSPAPQPPAATVEAPAPASTPALPWQALDTPAVASAEVLPAPAIRRRPASGGWYIPLVIVPLVSYSVLATIAVFILYKEQQKLKLEHPHPLEFVPDLQGDAPGVSKVRDARSQVVMPDPTEELPPRLKLKLGETRAFGNIEVTALRVVRRPIKIQTQGFRDDPRGTALCLDLTFKNLSTTDAFAPLDAFFCRLHPSHDPVLDQNEPYTRLEVGGRELIGGPALYTLPGTTRPRREWVKDQDVNHVLQPGEDMTTFVCTNPQKHDVDRLLQQNPGAPLLWRVQVRRGLVEFESRRTGKRTVPATTVIGVTFTEADIDKSS